MKISENILKEICFQVLDNKPIKEIAEKYGYKTSKIYNIIPYFKPEWKKEWFEITNK